MLSFQSSTSTSRNTTASGNVAPVLGNVSPVSGNITMQSVQNAAPRLITGARRQEHIMPVLRQLHWLPVRQQVRFKLACIMYKSLSGQTPQYLVDDVQLLADSGRRLLRSANYRACVVPRTQNSFGDRDFSVARPKIWNNLPQELGHMDICRVVFSKDLFEITASLVFVNCFNQLY